MKKGEKGATSKKGQSEGKSAYQTGYPASFPNKVPTMQDIQAVSPQGTFFSRKTQRAPEKRFIGTDTESGLSSGALQ